MVLKMFSQIALQLTLIVLMCLSVNASFPDDPKPCKYGDTDCFARTIEYFLREKYEGDASINLGRIDPLEVKKINIRQGAESPVNIDLAFDKNKIYGLRNSKVIKVKGFGKELKKKHEISLRVPKVNLVGNYKINGKILILPITGKGASNITMSDIDVGIVFSGAPFEKNGTTFMKIDKFRLNLVPRDLHFQIGGLFGGDKALGDNMLRFLNENWKDIFRELKVSIETAFGQIFQTIINSTFAKLPYTEFFSE